MPDELFPPQITLALVRAGPGETRAPTPAAPGLQRLAKIGAVLQVAPLAGIALTAAQMIMVHESFGHRIPTSAGGVDAEKLSQTAGGVLIYAAGGFLVSFMGIVLMLFAVKKGLRERWLFWTLVFSGVLWLVAFPAGTVIGLGVLGVMIGMRKSFLVASGQE